MVGRYIKHGPSNNPYASKTSRKTQPFYGLPEIEPAVLYGLLEQSKNKIVKDVFIDTDTYNEIDDQFALVQALLSQQLHSTINVPNVGPKTHPPEIPIVQIDNPNPR